MANAVSVSGLRKQYGDFTALDGLDFTVDEGEVVALLGPNGAGKTTTVEILEGYRRPTAGTVSVLGCDPFSSHTLRRQVGIVLQEAGFFPQLKVRETVEAWRRFYPSPREADEVIELVGLTDRSKVQVKDLSGGEQRRLDLALGIVGRPSLLFLDEPTTGFDPSARRNAWSLVKDLVEGGMTVLLTTHYLEEAQALADRIIIVDHGRIVTEGSPDTIGGRDTAPTTISFVVSHELSSASLPALSAGAVVQRSGASVTVHTESATSDTHVLTGWALDHGERLDELQVNQPSLEDTYLDILGATEPEAA